MAKHKADPAPKPHPAHDTERAVALPWHRSKAGREDAAAPNLIAAIMSHPSYAEADRDVDFLKRDDTRGLRQHLDDQNAENLLAADIAQQHAIASGSATRRGTTTSPGTSAASSPHCRQRGTRDETRVSRRRSPGHRFLPPG